MTVTEGAEIFLVDSNILIYNYDNSDTEKHEIAKGILDNCWEGRNTLAVSSQNLSEMFFVTTRKGLRSKEDGITDLSDIIKFPGWVKINLDHKTVLEAARISEKYDMTYWDALLAATMKQHGILNLYTENTKDFKVPWLNAVNPFGKK